MNGRMDHTFGAGNVQFVSAGADNNHRVLDVEMGLLVSENNRYHSGQHNFSPASGLILLSHDSILPSRTGERLKTCCQLFSYGIVVVT